MNIDEVIEKIITELKTQEYYYGETIGNTTILHKYNSTSIELCRKILKTELMLWRDEAILNQIEYKNKCEIYERIISNSNFKAILEKKKENKKEDKKEET